MLTVGPVQEAPSRSEEELIETLTRQKIEENLPFRVVKIPRETADRLYKESYLDEFGIPSSVKE